MLCSLCREKIAISNTIIHYLFMESDRKPRYMIWGWGNVVHNNKKFRIDWIQDSLYFEFQTYALVVGFFLFYFDNPYYFLAPFSNKFLSCVNWITIVGLTSGHSSFKLQWPPLQTKKNNKICIIQTKQAKIYYSINGNFYLGFSIRLFSTFETLKLM